MGRFTDLLTEEKPQEEEQAQPPRRFTDQLLGPSPTFQATSVPARVPRRGPIEALQAAPEEIVRTTQAIGRDITGEGKFSEDLPELRPGALRRQGVTTPGQTLGLLGGLATADAQGIADIVKEQIPGATVERDDFGNPIVNIEGRRFFTNKPGLTANDVVRLFADIAQFIPASKAGSLFQTIFGRTAAVGTAAGVTSVGQDLAAESLGSKQGIDPGKALAAFVAGGAFELLTPIAGRIISALGGRRLTLRDGSLTPEGVAAVRAAGLDPNDVTPEIGRSLEEAVRRLQSTGEEVVSSSIRSDTAREFDIPLTRGQATQDTRQVAREEAARNFARGEGAGRRFEQFDTRQQQAVDEAISRVQGGLSQAEQRTVATTPEAAAAIKDRLQSQGNRLSDEIDEAYRQASNLRARISGEDLKGLRSSIIDSLRQNNAVIFAETPSTIQALKELKRLVKIKGGTIKDADLRRIELFRRRLGSADSGLMAAARNPTDRRNIRLMKQELDRWLDDAFDNSLFEGDQAALDALKQARAKRVEFGQKFEASNLAADRDAGKAIEKMLSEDVSNVQAANWMFGNAKLGQTNRANQLVRRFERIFGRGSREWQILREGAFIRGLYGAKGESGRIGRQQLKSNLDEMLSASSREFVGFLFSPAEIAQIRRLRNAVSSTITPSRAGNPSRTGFEISRLIEDLGGKLAPMAFIASPEAAVVGTLAAGARAVTKRGEAKKATQGIILPPFRSTPFVATGIATSQSLGQ